MNYAQNLKKFLSLLLISVLFVLADQLIHWNTSIQSAPTIEINSSHLAHREPKQIPKDVSFEKKLGQNFIIGMLPTTLDEATKKVLKQVNPGGVILYAWNFQSLEQFKKLTSDLQKLAQEQTGQPFFIMLDEEPAGASRIGVYAKSFPNNVPDWSSIDNGTKTISDVGVNVVLAPLADYPFNKRSFIRSRIPGKSIEKLTVFNRRFIEILRQNNVQATLKHFPGAGMFSHDPHHDILFKEVKQENYKQSIQLFGDGIKHGANFVMTNHAIYKNIDPENPATLSSKIVNDVLRKELDFKGIIITDDIGSMLSPVWQMDSTEAGIKALKAGHTMIMYSHRPDNVIKVFESMLKKSADDKTLTKRVEDNYEEITLFKKEHLN